LVESNQGEKTQPNFLTTAINIIIQVPYGNS